MNLTKPTALTAAALAAGLFLLHAPGARAQAPATTPSVSSTPAPGGPGGGGPGGPGGGREDFRARMAERIKAQLKASDDEWTVIQPLLEKVGEKLMASRGGGGFGGPGGPGGPGGRENRRRDNNNPAGAPPAGSPQQPAAPDANRPGGDQRRGRGFGGGGSPETQALGAALADDNSTVNDIKAKLQALRDQRKTAATELAQAREELRKVLNMRQEAALVMDGLLD